MVKSTKSRRSVKILARPARVKGQDFSSRGKLLITDTKGIAKTYAWTWRVEAGRVVHLLATVPPAGQVGEIYTVDFSDRDRGPVCNCRGHQSHGHCKHAGALAVIAERERQSARKPAPAPAVESAPVVVAVRPVGRRPYRGPIGA